METVVGNPSPVGKARPPVPLSRGRAWGRPLAEEDATLLSPA